MREPILVVGATGNVGGRVERLSSAGARVRALVRRSDVRSLPGGVEVTAGDLTAPESLDPALDGVRAVFLLRTAPPPTAAAVAVRALLDDGHAGRSYVLTGPSSLTQVEQVDAIGEALGRRLRFEELTPNGFRQAMAGRWPEPVVEMLLAAWGATLGDRAHVTSTVAEVTGAHARSFPEWVRDHVAAFR